MAVRFWKPDAIVVNTLSDVMIKEKYPDITVIFFSGEGFHGPNDSHAKIWLEKPEYYENMDLGLVWGPKVKEECVERFSEDIDVSKIHVVGNPKLDLIKFLPQRLKRNKKNSVGFIGRFPKLNDHLNRSTMYFLSTDFQVEEAIIQCKSANAMIRAANKILEETDLNVSIRPHPHEQIESYPENISVWFDKKYHDRIDIDDSLFLPTWIAEQKAILSPTSTSFLEAYMLGVPVINLDYLSDIVAFNQNYISFTKEWQEAALMPKTYDDLIVLLADENALQVKTDRAIEKQLEEFSNKDMASSACLNAAICIMDTLKQASQKTAYHVPYRIVDLWDEISFRRNMRWNDRHHNFCYRRGYHKIPDYVDEIVDSIERVQPISASLKKAA
ncbi:MAG: hypothetical protein COA45_03710 [Zetaproteobacteria bacterium]|nr:MAG: hypothetical protein COA45_03710 [Zetaproteobacteria bacterium]